MSYTDLYQEFKEWLDTDNRIQSLWQKTANNTANYKDAENYSKRIGKWWSDKMNAEYGDSDYSSFIDDIEKSFRQAYSNSAYYSKNVQKVVNNKAGIGMRVIEPAIDEERLNNLLSKLADDGSGFLIGRDAVENFTRAAVTDTIQANARIQSEAGIYAYVERDSGSGCCEWCDSMSGRYEFGDQPDDFWRVHKSCTCTFEYKPNKSRIEHIRYVTNSNGSINKITS